MAREVNIFTGLLAISTFVNCSLAHLLTGLISCLFFVAGFIGGGVLVYSRNNSVFDVKIAISFPL